MKKKRLLIVCPYPQNVAPSQRLKFEQYYEHFKQDGFELVIKPFQTNQLWESAYKPGRYFSKIFWTLYGYISRLLLLFNLPKYDLVYVHLWVTPLGPPIMEWLYRKLSKRLIFDIDDLVFLGKTSDANKWITKLKGKSKPIYLMKYADHVITCTPFLDEYVRRYNCKTTDISSTIRTDDYQVVNNYQNDKILVLGWSGSHSTAKYLYLLKDVLVDLAKRYRFKLLVMGTTDFAIDGLDVECIKWSEGVEISTIQRFDIGLYPLPDELWVHGKSGLKALQYMACGIPTVATKVGAAIHRVIDDGVDGYLVYAKEEWLNRLEFLLNNPEERMRVGSNARDKVVQHFSIMATAPAYLKVLNEQID